MTTDRDYGYLLGLLRYVPGRQGGAFAEEEVFHVARHQLLRFLLPGHQPVLVQDHLLTLFPHLPRLRGDVFEYALTEFAGPRLGIESGQILLELDAVDHSAALVACRRRGRGAIIHIRHVTAARERVRSDPPPFDAESYGLATSTVAIRITRIRAAAFFPPRKFGNMCRKCVAAAFRAWWHIPCSRTVRLRRSGLDSEVGTDRSAGADESAVTGSVLPLTAPAPGGPQLVPPRPGGMLWTEFEKNVADLRRCRLKSSARSRARVGGPLTKRARPTSGPL